MEKASMPLTPETQFSTFSLIAEFESRARQIDALAAQLKQLFLTAASAVAVPEAVALLGELRWQLDQGIKRVSKIEDAVGVQRRTPPQRGKLLKKSPQGLRGTTSSLPIPDLLGLLSAHRKTGTLWIGSGGERFLLEFLEGSVVHAVSNNPKPEQRLGTILVAHNKIATDKLEEFLEQYAGGKGPIGEALAKASLVSESDLRLALEQQVRDLFHRIFALKSAQFVFCDGQVSDIELRVTMNTTHLLLDSARALDEHDPPEEDEHSAQPAAVDNDADAPGSLGTLPTAGTGTGPDTTFAESLEQIAGICRRAAEALNNAGYHTIKDIEGGETADLLDLPGVGRKTVETLRAHLAMDAPESDLTTDDDAPASEDARDKPES